MMNQETHEHEMSVITRESDLLHRENQALRRELQQPDPTSEYNITFLKEEINKVVWMFAAAETTLKEADNIAAEILRIFIHNREKHGHVGSFDTTVS